MCHVQNSAFLRTGMVTNQKIPRYSHWNPTIADYTGICRLYSCIPFTGTYKSQDYILYILYIYISHLFIKFYTVLSRFIPMILPM